mgnify:CR=1 FL=1
MRRCRFLTIFGSNDPSRSQGTSSSTSPTSVSTVFALVPFGSPDAVRWERIDLEYRGSLDVPKAWYQHDAYDQYVARGYAHGGGPLDVGVEALPLIERLGVRFGADTNVGTVWAA